LIKEFCSNERYPEEWLETLPIYEKEGQMSGEEIKAMFNKSVGKTE
jgi:tRNA U54 and U55 pseudouridine synthase Pus10